MKNRILLSFLSIGLILGIHPKEVNAVENVEETQSQSLNESEEASSSSDAALNEIEISEMDEEIKTTAEPLDDQISVSEQLGKTLSFLVETVANPTFGTGGGEWTILSLARAGYSVPADYYDIYYNNVVESVNSLMPETPRVPEGKLDRNKGSEHSRLIIGLTAIGKDATNVGDNPNSKEGYNIFEALADFDYMKFQGINGSIFALIALDSYDYEIPQVEGVNQATRQMYIDEILSREVDDGGWSLAGPADVDITAMAIQGLTPYYHSNPDVKAAIDRAITWLSDVQADNGGFVNPWGGGNNVESISQVIVALTGLGIDPNEDSRFIKNGHSAIDSLMNFAVPTGGFKHNENGEVNGMATDQAAYALVAYQRFINGQTSLYNMTDVQMNEEPQPEEPQPEEPQPEEPQPEEPQPEEPQPEDPQPEDPQPEETQPEEPQLEELQPEELQSDEAQWEESTSEELHTEEIEDEEIVKSKLAHKNVENNKGDESNELPKTGAEEHSIAPLVGMFFVTTGFILKRKTRKN